MAAEVPNPINPNVLKVLKLIKTTEDIVDKLTFPLVKFILLKTRGIEMYCADDPQLLKIRKEIIEDSVEIKIA